MTRSLCSAWAYQAGRQPADVRRAEEGHCPVKRAPSKERANSLHTKQSKESICPKPKELEYPATIKPCRANTPGESLTSTRSSKMATKKSRRPQSVTLDSSPVFPILNKLEQPRQRTQSQDENDVGSGPLREIRRAFFSIHFPQFQRDAKSHCA